MPPVHLILLGKGPQTAIRRRYGSPSEWRL
jgi:hypothetical protein